MTKLPTFSARGKLCIAAVLLAFTVAAGALDAQTSVTSVGSPQNAALFPVEHGFVNLGNGDLHLEIPIAQVPQRGDLSLPLMLVYDSAIWQIGNGLGGYGWEPTGGGWSLVYGANYGATAQIAAAECPGDDSKTIYTYTSVQWTDVHGTNHVFPLKTVRTNGCSDPGYPDTPTSQGYATDASGYWGALSAYDEFKVWDSAGTLVVNTVAPSAGTSNYAQVDRNGNEIQYGVNGSVQSDSLGHAAVNETVAQTDNTGAPTVLYLDVPSIGSQTVRYTIDYKTISVDTNFSVSPPGLGPVGESTASIRVVSAIYLPDGSSYSFNYDQACASGPCGSQTPTVSYGLLKGVVLPHGGTVSYSYNSDSNAGSTEPARWLSAHTGSDGTTAFTLAAVGPYPSTTETGGYSCSELKNTASGALLTTTYVFSNCGGSIQPMKILQSPTANPTSVDRFSLMSYDFSNSCQNTACTGAQWISLIGTAVVLPSNGSLPSILSGSGGSGLTAVTQSSYATPGSGRVSSVKQWDYASGTYPTSFPYNPSGNPKRETDVTMGYTVNNALYPTDVATKDSTGTTLAEIQFTYDEAGYFTASPSGVPSHSNSLAAANRGNATTVKRVPHGSGYTLPIITHVTYDDTGAVVAMMDGNGNTTSISHDSTDTYPQTVARPPTTGLGGHAVAHNTQTTHDFNTAATLSVTDENSQVTTYQYDNIGRLSTVQFSNGGSAQTLQTVSYPNLNETDTTIQQVNNAYTNQTIPLATIVDGYGRVTQKTQAGVTSEISYNAQGLVQSRANAHTLSPQPTDGQTTYTYDELGRVLSTGLPAGHATAYSYSLNNVTITDPLGHQHQQTYDVFGDLTSVLEPDATGSLTWLTNYLRTDLGFLKEIDQEGGTSDSSQWRQRYFTYDAFGRLAAQTSPEAGQYIYLYDNNGNVTLFSNQNSSANTVNSTYDALNRLVSKQIGGGPTYSFTYDAQDSSGDAYGTGRLTGMSDGVNVGALYTHDPFGHLTTERDSRPSNSSYAYQMSANYDFVGNLLALTYPDGRRMEWVYDQFNRPVEEVNTFFGADEIDVPLLVGGAYFPTGQLQDVIDGSGVELTTAFDPNGNITSLQYNNNGTLLVNRSYTWDINGVNLRGVSDAAAGRTQSFTYDNVNRLLTASDTGSTSSASNTSLPTVPSSSESFSYDAWGNLQQTGPYSYWVGAGSNNRLGNGLAYDAAGNLTNDGAGDSYAYRADGRQTSSNGTSYRYDALNQRVVKSGSATTEYFYFGGTLVATRNSASGAWNDLLYGANGLMAEVAGTEAAVPTYRISDHLNTLAQTTDDNGNVQGSLATQPYGQVLSNSTGDSFLLTDHEQDSENGTTYAQYRQYSATQGRWLSPDPYSGSYDLGNPQSFNRYVYALNSPLTLVDALGLDSCGDLTTFCINRGGGTPTGGGDYGGSSDGGGFTIGSSDGVSETENGSNNGSGSLQSSPSGVSQRSKYNYTAPGSNATSTSSSILDWTQTAFRALGAIPELGVVFNAANTGIDLARSNYKAAAFDGLATALSFVPGGAPAAEALGAAEETVSIASTAVEVEEAGAAFADEGKLLEHFESHGSDFGAQSATHYQSMASDFLTGDLEAGTLQGVRTTGKGAGDIVRFNPSTDEFGVLSGNGTIRTYYKPNPAIHKLPTNLDYFNRQF